MSAPIFDYGVSPFHLRFCPKCFPQLSVCKPVHALGEHTKFPWALDLFCPICHCFYTICSLCPNQRNPLLSNRHTARHNRLKHVHHTSVDPPLPVNLQVPVRPPMFLDATFIFFLFSLAYEGSGSSITAIGNCWAIDGCTRSGFVCGGTMACVSCYGRWRILPTYK